MTTLNFLGPTGKYSLTFEATEDASVSVRFGKVSLSWSIEVADGTGVVSGVTRGAKTLWGDEYWFEVEPHHPARISYWGENGYSRTDKEVPP